jgi:23S rRNA (uracil1939-C5)-methyltransferase
LFTINAAYLLELTHAQKWLIDPPREGAFELVKALVELINDKSNSFTPPSRIVYVSCNPATLARDAQVLVQGGYELKSAGIINMFPHTAHVESIAVFNRP